MVWLLLEPRSSDILRVYVDPIRKQVVKVFYEESTVTSSPEGIASEGDFTLTFNIPKNEYYVGESAEATFSLSYTGTDEVEVSARDGQYFDLVIKDNQGNKVYQWAIEHYSGIPMRSVPWISQSLQPGQTIDGTLKFPIPQTGTLYVSGGCLPRMGFDDWVFNAAEVRYPDGHGHGLNVNSPFIEITVR